MVGKDELGWMDKGEEDSVGEDVVGDWLGGDDPDWIVGDSVGDTVGVDVVGDWLGGDDPDWIVGNSVGDTVGVDVDSLHVSTAQKLCTDVSLKSPPEKISSSP